MKGGFAGAGIIVIICIAIIALIFLGLLGLVGGEVGATIVELAPDMVPSIFIR